MKKLLILAIFVSVGTITAQNFDEIEIKTTKVSDHIYMLEGSGGNIGVSIGTDGALIVDSQYAPLSEKIKKAIGNITDQPVKMLVNTHWHGDHVGGNENFGQMGVLIFAHENVKERMSKSQLMRAFSREIPASPEVARPVVTFSEKMGIKCNGEYLMLIHVDSAHTDGDALVYFPESDVLHMGDTYFNGRYPFIDLSSGGSIDGIIAAADRALFVVGADTKIIPGHGALSNRNELKQYREVLSGYRNRVDAMIKQGKSMEEIKAMKPGRDTDDTYGGGFIGPDRFLEIVFNSLSGLE
ncbi:MAG: MBL fold metallo-hydrolase [Saprospiraceae bacterium]|nr:MBL fold metallo-hydrolase [Saprospiraceae bacterium]